jgi:NAD(P)-dependent dehydrogenase (short-subunit alcohol dehydrogenase family)
MEQKVVLVTGAAKRIGKAIALHLASKGWSVVLHYNSSQDEANEVHEQIIKLGVDCFLVKADLSCEKQVRDVFKEYNNKFGKISCLINNASIFKNDVVDNLDSSCWRKHQDINLFAPIVLSQEFLKQLDGNKGNIINMIDYCVWSLPDKFLSYSISKYGLWGATKALAKQVAPNVRVNAIGPGHSLPNDKETNESFEEAKKMTPLKNGADVNEICRAIDFIIESPSFTGQMLALDGGKHLVGADFY